LVASILLIAGASPRAPAQSPRTYDTVIVHSGQLALRALIWRPRGRGPFPGILFNHGSGHGVFAPLPDSSYQSMAWQAARLGPVFARHGYVFLYLMRRGTGLSSTQGKNASDRWNAAFAAHGQAARDSVQLALLQTDELYDAFAALSFLRRLPEVDAHRVAVVGHSFGGSLSLLMAERDSTLRACVAFAPAAMSWPSVGLRRRLLEAAGHTVVPTLLIFAANDYSTTPGEALDRELSRHHAPHTLEIYPAVGTTSEEGHSFVHLRIPAWERDVFAFLAARLK
jgi:dienelactone hydrolase